MAAPKLLPQTRFDPWMVAETDFPDGGSASEQLLFLLNYAVLAPSGHNTQPWLFHVAGETVEIYADRRRSLHVVDPHDRELIISCGTALGFLRLAIRYFGYTCVLQLLPDRQNPDLLARVTLGGRRPPTSLESRLFSAIPQRRTYRMRFDDRAVPPAVLAELQQLAASEGAWLAVLKDERQRATLANLVAQGDRVQMADQAFRRELAAWVRSNLDAAHDGMPGYGFGFSDAFSYAGPLMIRTFDLGGFQAAKDYELAAGSPVLAVLGSVDDTPLDWLSAGQALALVLLRAQAEGIAASFLNQPVEVQELRSEVSDLLDGGCPQLVLRMGYGREIRPMPRRGVREVTL